MMNISPLDVVLVALNGFYFFYIVVLGGVLFRKRVQAVRTRAIDGRYFKVYQGEIPGALKAFENHFNNQFQMPLYFMVASVFAIITHATTMVLLVIAALFVISRFCHSWIHITSNNIPRRAAAYFTGVIAIALMWIAILIHLSAIL